MYKYDGQTETVDGNDLRIGDLCILWCGHWRVTAIRTYRGPLKEISALVDTDTGSGFSLCHSDSVLIAKRKS